MSLNLLRAHGSPTLHQYQHGCRCVACKGAKSASNAVYAANHKAEKSANAVAHQEERREMAANQEAEFARHLRGLRAVSGCDDCDTHEGFLLHHHVDPSTNRYNVSQMCTHSIDALDVELAKCVVLCMSCHRNRHLLMEAAACA